ncbi:MAG: DUF2975 domain-containing protein [Oligoflexus sp.]|nr:DUF2975 domain-containing protein [Pseudopedobacter sp.]
MIKLYLLKAIIDFVWIIALISVPFLLIFVGYLLIINEPFDVPINMNGIKITVLDLNAKIALFFVTLSYLLLLHGLYLIKKLLRLFQLKIIFDNKIIFYFNRIGNLFILFGFVSGIPAFFYKVAQGEIKIEIGANPFLYLISLGLFFTVLAEVFKMGKQLKEENELTI